MSILEMVCWSHIVLAMRHLKTRCAQSSSSHEHRVQIVEVCGYKHLWNTCVIRLLRRRSHPKNLTWSMTFCIQIDLHALLIFLLSSYCRSQSFSYAPRTVPIYSHLLQALLCGLLCTSDCCTIIKSLTL